MFQEPPLEILKTKVAQSITAGAGPQVSVHGSSGIIPGPSDEPVHNSLDAETYLLSTTPLPVVQLSTTLKSQHVESTPASDYNQESNADISSGTANAQTKSSTTEPTVDNHPVSNHGRDSPYSGYQGSQNINLFHNVASLEFTDQSSGGNYPKVLGLRKEKPRGRILAQNQGSSQPSYTETAGYSAESTIFSELPPSAKGTVDIKSEQSDSSSQQTYGQVGDSSSFPESHQGHEITSYLADSNAAIDVTSQGLSRKLSETPLFSPNTRISAVLVAEGGNKYEENEIRNNKLNYIPSTTTRPPKTGLKPIVVSETEGTASPLALFSAHGVIPSGGYRSRKIGKLYHREGYLRGSDVYKTSSPTSVKTNTDDSYYSTPNPTTAPVLVTPKFEASPLTSAGNFLAPIQAGVSISNHKHPDDCDNTKENGNNGYIPSSGPDIEKQVIREEAVYKTTVDIQKSIPFEIHPNDDASQNSEEENSHLSGELSNENLKENYYPTNEAGYNGNTNNGYNSHVSSEEYDEHFEKGASKKERFKPSTEHLDNSVEYAQNINSQYEINSNEGYHHNPNTKHNFKNIPSQQIYPDSEKPIQSGYVSDFNSNQENRNNFIQQVLHSYHKMANNNQHSSGSIGYPPHYHVPTQPLFVPNRLYYVYLQRYNPYVTRYGTQDQFYAPYLPVGPSGPASSEGYGINNHYDLNGNQGYATIVKHNEGTHNDHSNTNINQHESDLPEKDVQTGDLKHLSNIGSSENYEGESGLSGIRGIHHSDYSGTNQVVDEQQRIVYGQTSQEYSNLAANDVQQSSSIINNAVPQHFERTKLIESNKPVHLPYTVPVDITKTVEKPSSLEYSNVVSAEEANSVPRPVPYAVTKLVALNRPDVYPQPIPIPYPVHHPVGVPVPQLVPNPHVVPVKNYRPVYVYRKASAGRLLHREPHHVKHIAFRPSQPVFASQYPPHTYQVTGYLRGPHTQSRGQGRKLCIEYGGFKPPLVPSTPVEDEPKPSYGPPAEDNKSS